MEENNQSEIAQPAVVIPTSLAFGNWWKIGILIVGLVLAGSIVFAAWQFSQKQTVIYQPTPTPMIQPNPTPTPDPTANWKTYTNDQFAFSFKYPEKSVEVIECVSKNIYISSTNRHYDPCQSSGGRFYISIKEKNFTLPDWYYRDYSVKKESIVFNSKTVDKYSGTRFLKEPAPIPSDFSAIVVSGKLNTIVIMVEIYDNTAELENKLTDQILSTFKFLE